MQLMDAEEEWVDINEFEFYYLEDPTSDIDGKGRDYLRLSDETIIREG